MSDSAIFVSDYKDYEIGGKAIGIGSLECKAIFGPSLRAGVTYSKEHLSRKQIVPKIMEILQ